MINTLQEGKSLVELVSGLAHDELEIAATVSNCMRLHQRLVTLGTRWMPQYDLVFDQAEIDVDAHEWLENIRALGPTGNLLALEQILTEARYAIIRAHIQRKTLIYTHLYRRD